MDGFVPLSHRFPSVQQPLSSSLCGSFLFTGRAIPSAIVRDRYGGLTASVGAHRFYGPLATTFLAVPQCLFRVSSTSPFSRFPLIPRFPCFPEFRAVSFVSSIFADSFYLGFLGLFLVPAVSQILIPWGYDDGSDYRCFIGARYTSVVLTIRPVAHQIQQTISSYTDQLELPGELLGDG